MRYDVTVAPGMRGLSVDFGRNLEVIDAKGLIKCGLATFNLGPQMFSWESPYHG